MHRSLPIVTHDAEARRALATARPARLVSLKLKLVDGCNLRCFMCDYWRGRRAGELTTAEVGRVLDEAAAAGCVKVNFTGGEVLMRRDVVELAAHAAARGLRVNLTTNGTLLTGALARALLAIPVRSITLSIDSPVAKLHDRARGRAGAFVKTTRALDRVLARRGAKTRVRLNTVVSTRTYRSLLEMIAFLRDRPIDGWRLLPVDPWTGPAGDGGGALGLDDIRAYTRAIAPALADAIRVPGFDPWVFGRDEAAWQLAARGAHARGAYDAHPCYAPWLHLLVDARGECYPCCAGHGRLPALGNVRAAGLAAIFAGPAATRFRADMLRARPALCATCDDFLVENAEVRRVLAAAADDPRGAP